MKLDDMYTVRLLMSPYRGGDGELIVSLTGSEGSYCSTLRFCCSVCSIHTIHIKFVPTSCIFIQYSSFYGFGWNANKFAVSRRQAIWLFKYLKSLSTAKWKDKAYSFHHFVE
ncbi:unnamed protein product [Wuchereria bancrofti]|uniref:Uncharacterized protein n=1 Tax=Wuchereria bancrofti TaxID=6293 RepID=A0A3P7FAT2_WUCBA|nr:unnamed protein product [Wuchereria bancrofti]